MAIKITTTKKASVYKKILVYGPSGIGKTEMVKTYSRPLLITSENKTESLADEDIDVWKVETIGDFEEAIKKIIKHPDNYDIASIDSISDIHETAVMHEKPNHKDPRKAYGVVQEKLVEILKKIRDSDSIHFYVIAKVKMIQNDENYDMYAPKMSGAQLGQEVPYLFDYVFAMRMYKGEDGETYRYLQTSPEHDPKWTCKGSKKLNKVEKPDLTYLINKMSTPKIKKDKKKNGKDKKV